MKINRIIGMVGAATLAATPIAAHAADASRLSIASAATAAQGDAEGGPDRSLLALGVLGAVAVATGVAIVLTDGDDDEEQPTSP